VNEIRAMRILANDDLSFVGPYRIDEPLLCNVLVEFAELGLANDRAPDGPSSASLPLTSATRRGAYPAATRSLPSTAAARITQELRLTSKARQMRKSKRHGTALGVKPSGVPDRVRTSSSPTLTNREVLACLSNQIQMR
jgi:hypothetical protein